MFYQQKTAQRPSAFNPTVARMACSVFALLAYPTVAQAQTASNTATVAMPAGAFDTNSANNSATDSDTVYAAIVAANDSVTGINGATGATAVVNAFTADTINGAAASTANAVLSLPTGSVVPAGLTFTPATGNVDVAAGTPAGTYSFDYQICEKLNPTNCKIATISVTVVAAPIAADADSVTVTGASAADNALNVLDGDTFNGAPATLAAVDLSVVTPAASINGGPVPTLGTDGLVDVPAGTPAGTYAIEYKICDKLNPSNCATNTATIIVQPSAIVAANDSVTDINGATGATAVVNAFTADTINGAAASTANAVLSLAPGATVPAGLTFTPATGNVDVAAGTPAGTYSFDYQICEKLNPTNCKIATISVTVVAAPIAADADSVTVTGASAADNALNVLDGDTFNGAPATLAAVDLSVVTPAASINGGPVPTLGTDGLVDVPAGTPAGTYAIEYKICDKLNPSNCATNTATIIVQPSAIVAANDSVSGINGATGATAVVNAFTADTINGAAASTANAVLSLPTGSVVPAGLTFTPATGNVDVAAGTPAGTYSFDYQICEKLNPTNCKIATISVTVVAAPIAADADSVTVTGASAADNALNVLDGDTFNGAPATLAAVDLSVVTPAASINGGPVPTLGTDGLVDVPAGTPAGTYAIEYKICDKLNPSNCATNTATIIVQPSAIVAANDSVSGINGATGATAVVNAFTADTINGAAASTANAVLSLPTGSVVPAGLTFTPATGNVDVAAGTPAGTYSFDYQICEKLNPTNCKIATISVTVVAAPIAADADSVTVTGASAADNALNVLDGDTFNGAPATLAAVDLSVVTPAASINGGPVPTLGTDGLVDVPAGTPAGTYAIEYKICDKLNPSNCATNTATIIVQPSAIVAANDSVSGINGATGATAVVNAFTADTINGAAASTANAVLSLPTGSVVPAGLTFTPATGNVDVAAGTPAGTYSFDYQICEKLNPTNCKIATISVTVVAAPITADADAVSGINGAAGGSDVVNVLDGDTLNGQPVSPTTVDLTVTAPATPINGGPVPTLGTDGLVDVPPGTPAGTYTISYQICEKLNPTNCATNAVTVTVDAAPLVATNDSATGVNGASGATAVVNAFTSDTLNGVAASPSNVTLSLAAGSTVPQGLTFDAATGNVDVVAGTPAGTYSFDYTICEKLNPTNCKTATISVTVEAAPIVATNDVTEPVRSGTAVPNAVNVLTNDTLNGQPVTLDTVTLTLVTSGHPGITLDPATGNVAISPDVPEGTYSLTYQICEKLNPTNCTEATVQFTILEPKGAIAGTVYDDLDGDRVVDSNEPRRANWIVEIVRNGDVIATTRTDADGNYEVDDLDSGGGYEIRFRNPENNVVFDVIKNVTVGKETTLVDQNQPIDPSGVIFDSITRRPVAGATAVLLGRNGTPLPGICFIDVSQASQTTGAGGEYRFDIVPGAAPECPVAETEYYIRVTPPAGYAAGSTVIAPLPGPFDPTGRPAPVRISPTADPAPSGDVPYYLDFRLQSGDPDVIFNHIALDPFLTRTPLVVTKTSIKRSASVGDIVPYEITVRNVENAQRVGVTVVDILPPGMKYITGSGFANGIATEPQQLDRQLNWVGQTIPANGSVKYNLTLVIGAGVTGGEKVNTGLARNGADGTDISNRGTAVVSVVPSAVFDCSELLGKVFEDINRNGYQDEGEPGVPGARLATVNGQLITTDAEGRYHIACAAVPDARIGSNFVLKLDTRTLPLGWDVTTDNPRSIRLTRGKFGELNFGVAPAVEGESPPAPVRKEGE